VELVSHYIKISGQIISIIPSWIFLW